MRNLLTDADRDRLVAPLLGPLAGEVTLGGRGFRALAETPRGGLFALGANAHAAELLLLPGLRARHAAFGDALLDFVIALAEAEPRSRRALGGGLALRRDDPRDLEILTPGFRFTGDLARGVLRQEPRAPGGPAVLHTGNLVEFAIGLRRSCADAEDGISDFAVEQRAGCVVLRHAATIRGEAGLIGKREVPAGRLEIAYEIRPDSPVLRVTTRFTAARRLSGVRVTTALDGLAEGGLGTGVARLLEAGSWREVAAPAAPGAQRWAEGRPVAHLALGRAGWPAEAPVLHLRPADPARVISVTAEARQAGAVHWLLLRHGPADLAEGESLTVTEDRLFAPGGDVAEVAAAMGAARPGLDLDPAPPSGAALQAVAGALMLDAIGAWDAALTPVRREALAGFARRQGARLEAEAPVGELGHALVGADALRRAGIAEAGALQSRWAARLAAALRVAPAQSLAAHAAALHGLARAAAWPDAPDAASAIGPLLAALRDAGDGRRPGLMLGETAVNPATDLPGLALLARAAGTVVLAAEAGAPIQGEAAARATAIHRSAIALMRPAVRPAADGLVVTTAGGVSPAPQALLALALLAPDRLAFGALAAA